MILNAPRGLKTGDLVRLPGGRAAVVESVTLDGTQFTDPSGGRHPVAGAELATLATAQTGAWTPDWAMSEDDPLFLRECEWVRRNGKLAVGTVIGREGKCLIVNALDVRAAPFKVPEHDVKIT